MAYLGLGCRCVIGLVFLVSAVSKLRSRAAFDEFTAWMRGLPLPATGWRPGLLAAAMTATEAAIVLLAALPWTPRAALALAAAALAVFTGGTWLAIARGADQPCQCFGSSTTPLGRRHVVRDAVLGVIAVAGALSPGPDGARAAGVAVSLFAGVVIALCLVFLDDLAAVFAPGDADPGLLPGDGR